MSLRFLLTAGTFLTATTAFFGATFTTLQGQAFEGEIKALYENALLIGAKGRNIIVDVNSLDDTSLLPVAEFLKARPAESPKWSQSSSKVAQSVQRKLQVLQNGKLVPFDPGSRPEPEFYVVYYGALWCGPCRRFSPRLVEAYHRLKATAADRFEVIFVSSDQNDLGQITYAKEVNMPWPIVKFSQAQRIAVFEQWRARGIPSVVVLTRDGDALFHSYKGEEYLGPDDPLTKFTRLLQATSESGNEAPHPQRHRLAMAQHLLAAQGGDLAAKPYLLGLDRSRLRTLTMPRIEVQLTISAQGKVDEVDVLTKLDPVQKELLRRHVEKWLFLPAVEQGQPRASQVVLPIELAAS